MNITIAIADDHPMVINGLKDMLADSPHLELAATYPDGDTLLAGLARSRPDVLLLDIRMPGRTGDELVPQMLRLYPGLRVLVLTNFDNMLYIHTLLKAGVMGYLLKNTDQETLVAAIESVHRGTLFLKADVAEKLEQFRKNLKRSTSSRFALTPREKDILKLIAEECSNQQIAEKLCLSLRTVENYRLHLSLKLEVKNTAGLVRKAIEMGLILY